MITRWNFIMNGVFADLPARLFGVSESCRSCARSYVKYLAKDSPEAVETREDPVREREIKGEKLTHVTHQTCAIIKRRSKDGAPKALGSFYRAPFIALDDTNYEPAANKDPEQTYARRTYSSLRCREDRLTCRLIRKFTHSTKLAK